MKIKAILEKESSMQAEEEIESTEESYSPGEKILEENK